MSSESTPWQSFVIGVLVTIVGGVALAYILKEGRFSNSEEKVKDAENVNSKRSQGLAFEDIPAKIEINSILFFADKPTCIKGADWRSSTRFLGDTTPIIGVNIGFSCQGNEPKEDFTVKFEALCYNSNDEIVDKYVRTVDFPEGYIVGSIHIELGDSSTSFWKKDRYRVEFFLAEKIMTTKSFSID